MRQLIPYVTNLTIGPRGRYCGECHILLSNENREYFCQVCQFLFDLMADNPYFIECHRVWGLDRYLGVDNQVVEGDDNEPDA